MEWFTLSSTIAGIISNIVNITKYFESKNKDGFQELVVKTYRDVENVVDDYFKMFRETMEILENSNYSAQGIRQAHQYVQAARDALLPVRIRVRSALSLDYFKEPGPLTNFCDGIIGIMYSGFDATATTTTDKQVYRGENAKARHTILSLLKTLELYFPEKELSDDRYVEFYGAQQDLPHVISEIKTSIEENWGMVSKSYYQLLATEL